MVGVITTWSSISIGHSIREFENQWTRVSTLCIHCTVLGGDCLASGLWLSSLASPIFPLNSWPSYIPLKRIFMKRHSAVWAGWSPNPTLKTLKTIPYSLTHLVPSTSLILTLSHSSFQELCFFPPDKRSHSSFSPCCFPVFTKLASSHDSKVSSLRGHPCVNHLWTTQTNCILSPNSTLPLSCSFFFYFS